MHYANTIICNLLTTAQKVCSHGKALGRCYHHSQVTFTKVSQATHD